MLDRLKDITDRWREIERLIADPEVIQNPARYAALMKERGGLSRTVARVEALEAVRRELAGARDLAAASAGDPEMRKMADEEAAELAAKEEGLVRELEEMLLTDDGQSGRNAIVEIRPGTGGEEAALFAGDLFTMYSKYAEKRGWKAEILEMMPSERGGVKEAIFSLEGEDVFRDLRYESGTHRVQRVPATETQGRIHTSACTVAVLPEAEEVDIQLKKEDMKIDHYCAGGPGGQHVNKTASAVRLTHLATGIVAACQTERSATRNMSLALKWMKAKLYDHFASQAKNERDAQRKSQIGTGDRSEKIRTYNFPQSRVTDHRIGWSSHNLPVILQGELGEMIEALRKADREAKLKAMTGPKKT